MSYTTVHKDYHAATFEEAAAAMLRDPEVWDLTGGWKNEGQPEAGEPKGYAVESWMWVRTESGNFLHVNFR